VSFNAAVVELVIHGHATVALICVAASWRDCL
jgi:hypothetical protein